MLNLSISQFFPYIIYNNLILTGGIVQLPAASGLHPATQAVVSFGKNVDRTTNRYRGSIQLEAQSRFRNFHAQYVVTGFPHPQNKFRVFYLELTIDGFPFFL